MSGGRWVSAAAMTARAISVASVRPIKTSSAPESSRLASRMSLTIRASRSDSPEITSSIPSSWSMLSETSSRRSVIAAP